jgi:tetratricopeptide (TPR) repeat protein
MCGLPLGLTSYAAVRGLVPVRSEPVRCPPSSREAFLISTLAVLVVHLVNTGFAFAVAAPALLFWVCMGIAMGTQDVTPADSKAEKCDQMRGILGGAVGAALAAVLVAFAFVCVFSFDPTPVAGVLYRSITRIRFDGAPSHLLSIVLIPSWIGIAFAFSLDHAWRSRDLGWVGVCLSCAIALAAAGFTGAYLKAAQIGAVGHLSEKLEYDGAALVQGRRYEAICIGLMAAILLLMAAWGFCCVPSRPVARQRATRNELRAGVVAIAFTLALCWVVCTNLIRADALAGWANALGDGGELPMAVATYKSAIEIDPHSSTYRFDLADMLIKSAEASDSPAVFANDMETAEAVLKAGRGISRLDQGGFILGSVYLRWAAGETRPSRRSSLAQKARQSFLEDLEFEPWSEVALVDLAAADDMYLGDVSEAADALKRANALIPDRESNEWFDFYAQLSLASRYPEIRRFYARRAFWCRDEALQYAGRQRQSVFSLRLRGAMLHYRFGELAPALDECRLAANDEHNADEWQAEALLAAIFNELGNRVSAAEHVRKAIQEAPEEKRASLDALRARLNAS